MDCWINKENLKIREGKKEELQSFLEEALDKKGCTLEELFCSYLDALPPHARDFSRE